MPLQICSFLLCFLFFASFIEADDKWSQLRISSLLPNLDSPLSVEPALPADFVAMSPKGSLNVREWIYWGPRSVLENYFRDPTTLKKAVIRVKLSESIKQIGPGKFNEENDKLVESLARLNLKRMYDIKRAWGRYPLYILAAQFPDKWLHAAWVGLDDGAGNVLMFEMIYPKEGPSEDDYKLWNDFFAKTTLLKEPFYSHGYKLQFERGRTLLEFFGAKVKVTGEVRTSDNKIRLIVDPTQSGMQFELGTVSYEIMAPHNALGGSAARIQGVFTPRQSRQEIVVIINSVDAFSMEKEEALAKGFVVYEETLPTSLEQHILKNL